MIPAEVAALQLENAQLWQALAQAQQDAATTLTVVRNGASAAH